MRLHQQTIFSAEYLQPDWLAHDQQQTVTWLTTRLPASILGGCVGLFALLLMAGDTHLVFQMGLLGGFVGKSLSQQVAVGPARVSSHLFAEKQAHFSNALLLSMLVAVSYAFSLSLGGHEPSNWVLEKSCILGLGSGLNFWLFQGLISRMPSQPGGKARIRPSGLWDLTAWFTRLAAPSFWQATLVLGAGTGLSYGLSLGLSDGLSLGLISDLSFGLSDGLKVSVMVVLVHAVLNGAIGSLRFAERIQWTGRDLLRRQHLRTSLIVAGALFLIYGLSFGLSQGLMSEGLSNGLSFGLSFGLSQGLSYWMLLGLYQGMKQGHLEDQDRQQFNQGVRRSLRNGLLIGLISALIISAMSVLSSVLFYVLANGLSNGLSQGLSFGLSQGLSDGLIVLFLGILIMWALSGGLTVLRHYVIRWHLARHHTFPWRAQAFLDDATSRILLQRVGGGYSFIHRRLQDYFADTEVPLPEK